MIVPPTPRPHVLEGTKALCRQKFQKSASACGVCLTNKQVDALEAKLIASAAAYEQPYRDRYPVMVLLDGWRLRMIFNARLGCLVALTNAEPFFRKVKNHG